MSVHDDLVYVRHIPGAIEKVRAYTAHLSEAQFMTESLVQDAVVRQFEIIGEATKKVSADFRAQHRGNPWSHMARMRGVLIDHYWEVDLDVVWTSLTRDLPKLEPLLAALV